eukprot:GFUD01036711.1.p1 GENE.GFUD01036711.1~~GFUD01036711.1.p1  ORF type:complete len:246 (-),score=70.24 GFUD01036711.1:20-757(-)
METRRLSELPEEVLRIIFTFLPHKDLLSVVLVSQLWRELGENPLLWKRFTLCIRREHVRRINEVMEIKRLKHLQKIRFSKFCLNNATDNATVFNVIAFKTSVKELIIRGSDLSKVSPDVLATCLNNMDKVEFVPHIWGTGLTFDQVEALFNKMKIQTRLKVLNIRSNNLSRVQARVMAECVNRLEEVDMWNTSLNTEQVEQMLLLNRHSTKLKSLNISGNYFAMLDVPQEIIEEAKQKIPKFEHC